MKFFWCLCIPFFVGTLGVYAQTYPVSGSETRESPKIILERDWYNFNSGILWNQYRYVDGTLLKYRNVRSIIGEIPENKTVLREERGWLITNTVTWVLCLGSALTWAVYSNHDEPYADTVRLISGYSTLGTLAVTAFANERWKYTMRKAITNYNLAVQGIPIPLE
jgi:hypothetical protein